MRVWNVQIEKKKIDHMSIKKAIGKISQDAGEQKRQRDVAPNIGRSSPEEENHEIAMKKVLLLLNEPNAAPVFVTLTRLKKSGITMRGSSGLMNRRTACFVH